MPNYKKKCIKKYKFDTKITNITFDLQSIEMYWL